VELKTIDGGEGVENRESSELDKLKGEKMRGGKRESSVFSKVQ
jgi:hypothetical protein